MNRGRRGKKKAGKGSGGKKASNKESAKREMTKSGSTSVIFGSREEPSPDFKDQYLFLMEFFVHHVTGDRLAKLNQMFFVPTSICFEFLDFKERDGIEITPVDPFFEPQAGIADDIEYFYAGRSVMFAIDRNFVTKKNLDFIVKMTIHKRMPEGVKPDILVGVAELDLSKHFAALRKEMLQCWHRNKPPPKIYEDEVPLMYNQTLCGAINIYIRMSAFGQTIVTEFEAPKSTISSFVFKGEDINDKTLAYKCRIIDSETANIYKDSKDNLYQAQKSRPTYSQTEHSLSRKHHAGDTVKRDAGQRELTSITQERQTNLPALTEESNLKPQTCADVTKHGGLIQTSRGPAQPCGKAVVLKVSGLLKTDDDTDKKTPTVTVASESEAIGPDNPPDSEHDVFVLRIGKKGLVGVGEKSDIQLEMRTPKGPERRPPIRYETREMQTEADDKKKKGKKGKKKKKK